MSFLSEYGKHSSMRIAFLFITICVGLLVLSMATLVLSSLWLDHEVSWEGMAALMGAVGSPLGVLAGAKAYQKKHEENLEEYN